MFLGLGSLRTLCGARCRARCGARIATNGMRARSKLCGGVSVEDCMTISSHLCRATPSPERRNWVLCGWRAHARAGCDEMHTDFCRRRARLVQELVQEFNHNDTCGCICRPFRAKQPVRGRACTRRAAWQRVPCPDDAQSGAGSCNHVHRITPHMRCSRDDDGRNLAANMITAISVGEFSGLAALTDLCVDASQANFTYPLLGTTNLRRGDGGFASVGP